MARRRRTGWTGRPRLQHASAHGTSEHGAAATLRVTKLVVSPVLHVLPSRILPPIEPISGRKHTELNRQIREVERPVTYRKQTTATCSNRQKNQKWTSTFLPEIAQARMFSFSLRTEQAILPEGGSR
jgi:hypothetical protein